MKKWNIQKELKNKDLSIDEIVKLLLGNRGLKNKKDVDAFLHPSLESITPESVGIEKKQLDKSLKRIEKAIKNKEQIVIFGDYDVDGITATAILWEVLYMLSASVTPYIPHRVEEGYGLSRIGIDNVLEQTKSVQLIITVDNGIVAYDAVTYAKEKGIDVIVTDHHVAQEGEGHTLPAAYSFVHTTSLCGAGIAWVLAHEIKKKFEVKSGRDNHLELAALGTIADLVPLTGANRTIVKSGLSELTHTTRPGLLELFRQAACDINTVDVYHIGHIIAPRLNAAGRLESGMDSLRLLCTNDPKRAVSLAYSLTETNRQRQNIMTESAQHASLSIRQREGVLKKLLFVSHESYKEGVIGLIAGKMVEEFYRPAIAVAIGDKKSKGSVRSITGFNIIEFLRLHSDYFINVGGHPMAAGFTIETAKLSFVQELLEKKAQEILPDDILQRVIKVDCELSLSDITEELYTKLQTLAPFGMGNPEPTFLSRHVRIEDMRFIGKEGDHVKLVLSQNDKNPTEAIAFRMRELFDESKMGDHIDIIYTIDQNVWNGIKRMQLKVKDIK